MEESVLTGFLFLLVLLGLFVIFVAAEFVTHSRNLRKIPIRLHVNGTRGKSSVTRLLTAALNGAGIRTFGKTTGTLPRMLFPDGREYPVYRPGGRANVLEQLRIVSVARQYNADAIVIECMALQPRLQWLSEEKLVQATHGVVTNAREDHLDVMGPGERDVALALAGMTPRGNKFFTADKRHVDVFEAACQDRGSRFFGVGEAEVGAITKADMAGFPYHEHEENVALVLEICKDLGVPRQTAIEGMWKVAPDEGALKSFEVDFFGRRINFINGFAANDPESTERIWRLCLDMFPDVERRIAVFNTRVDRAQRSQQLAEAYARWPVADSVLLMGTGTYIFAREASKRGVDPMTLVHREGADAAQVFETLVGLSGRSSVICGMANIAGAGLELVHFFENRSIIKRHVG
jgi:poly-gamma-glutamate synthase PgsB/CapB